MTITLDLDTLNRLITQIADRRQRNTLIRGGWLEVTDDDRMRLTDQALSVLTR